jgi:hypothetical protein
MFGQNPQVGISNLPIDPNILDGLATEMDVQSCLGLDPDVPLEESTFFDEGIIEPSAKKKPSEKTKSTAVSKKKKTKKKECPVTAPPEPPEELPDPEPPEFTPMPITTFHSDGFKGDVTDRLIDILVKKATVRKGSQTYFGWLGVGIQCGICFNAIPRLDYTLANSLMDGMEVPPAMRKSPPELLTAGRTGDVTLPSTLATSTSQSNPDGDVDFKPSHLTSVPEYGEDIHHRWLSILLKTESPVNPAVLKEASLRSCFAIVVKLHNVSDPWTRVIGRKVRKNTWEILDEFGESVLDTVEDDGGTKLTSQWGQWFRHPTITDYWSAIQSDKKRKKEMEGKEIDLNESPARKKLRDDAYGAMVTQGRAMKKAIEDSSSETAVAVGSIVQVPLHDVDTTKVDGKNLTLIVVEVVKKKGNSCPLYRLACKAGVLDRLYHPSYLTVVQSTSVIMGLEGVVDEWTGLPKIKERKAAASVSIVGGQGKHLGCGCKHGTCQTKRCSCFKAGLLCNSKCHGGINKKCANKANKE